jgi:hypothetical protein
MELGKNIAIVWGVRTGMQAGGERAGRQVLLTVDDVRALQTESTMIAVVSAEIQRGAINVKSSYNAGQSPSMASSRNTRRSARSTSTGDDRSATPTSRRRGVSRSWAGTRRSNCSAPATASAKPCN